jgi:hypothetical protein
MDIAIIKLINFHVDIINVHFIYLTKILNIVFILNFII